MSTKLCTGTELDQLERYSHVYPSFIDVYKYKEFLLSIDGAIDARAEELVEDRLEERIKKEIGDVKATAEREVEDYKRNYQELYALYEKAQAEIARLKRERLVIRWKP